jgi:CheY-like chemotaxis protein
MVDDDPEDQQIFKGVIEGIDSAIDVSFSENGAIALEQITLKGRPDVVFLDCVMPVMDGIEFLTKIKSNKSTRHIPVVMYTSSKNTQENQLAIRLGAFELIHKTNNMDKLTSDIRETVSLINNKK